MPKRLKLLLVALCPMPVFIELLCSRATRQLGSSRDLLLCGRLYLYLGATELYDEAVPVAEGPGVTIRLH